MAYCTPYTYLVGWSKYHRYYYGVRYARGCKPQDLWVTYFTSSRQVKKFREEFGEPDVVLVRKVFKDRDSARLWEHKVLRRMKVINSEVWLNATDNISFSMETSILASHKAAEMKKGQPHSDTHRDKISKALRGKKRDPKVFVKVAETKRTKKLLDPEYTGGPRKGRVFSEEHRKKLSEAKKGKPGRPQTLEEREKRSTTMKERYHADKV